MLYKLFIENKTGRAIMVALFLIAMFFSFFWTLVTEPIRGGYGV